MKEMRRVLALVLCLVMLIGIVPAAAFATESEAPAEESGYTDLGTKTAAEGNEQQDPLPEEIQQLVGAPADAPALAADGETPIDAALFFSDLHTNANNYKDADIKRILGGLKNFGMKFSTVNSVGDAFSNNENKYTGYTSTITKSFQEAMGYSDFEMYYVWTDHDRGADIDNFTGLLYGDESTNYYLYTISMSDMSSSERYGQPSTFTESKLSDFTAAVEAMDHSKPLFILSHMPLHDRRNDNQYADEWYGVISAAAEKMDIAFFWGHNHTQEPVSEQAAYYVAKNGSETMMVEGMSKAVTPNFTYLCAGYMSPASTGYTASTTRQETVVAVTLYEDQVVYTLYDEDGAVSGDFALNEAVKRDHAAPKVEEPEVTEQTFYDDPDSPWASMTATAENGSVTDIYDDTNEDVNVLFQDGYWFGYDFALEGQVADTSVTIQMLLDPDAFDADNIAVYYFNGESYVAVTDYAVTADEGGLEYITISDAALGTYVYGTPNTDDVIPEGAVLKSLTVTPPDKTKYFDTDSQEREVDGQIMNIIALESDGMVVMANYTHGADKYTMELEWNQFGTLEEGYALSFEPLVAGQYGSQTVTVSYGGVSAAFTVWVCPEQLIIEGEETVVIDFDTASITGMVMGKVEDEAVLQTVAKTLEGLVTGALTVYDFTPTYANGDTALSGTASVTLPIPEGVEHPAVYYVSDDGRSFEKMPTTVNAENGTVTFTTEHFSRFVVAEDGTQVELDEKVADVEGSSTTTHDVGTPVTIYRRVGNPVLGKHYLIVAINGTNRRGLDGDTSPYTLNEFNAGNATYYTEWTGDPATSTLFDANSDTYLTTNNAYLWTVGEGYTFSNGNNVHLGCSYGSLSYQTASEWTYSNDKLTTTNRGSTYYLRVKYSGGNSSGRIWSVSTKAEEKNYAYNIYFYEPVTITPVTTRTDTVPGHIYSVEVADILDQIAIADRTVNLTSRLKDTSTTGQVSYPTDWDVVYSVEAKGTPGVATLNADGTAAILTGTAGTAVIRATYTNEDGLIAYAEFAIVARTPVYSLEIENVPADSKMMLGSTYDLNAQGDMNGIPQTATVAWTVENGTGKATVNENGVLTPVSEGTVTVTATWTENGKTYASKSVTLEIVDAIWTIELCEPVDGSAYTKATAYQAGTQYYVLRNGTYEAVNITAFAEGVDYYTMNVITAPVVIKNVKNEQPSPKNVWAIVTRNGIDLGDLEDEELIWTSSNTDILVIDPTTGEITLKGEKGTAQVSVAYYIYEIDDNGNVVYTYEGETIYVSQQDADGKPTAFVDGNGNQVTVEDSTRLEKKVKKVLTDTVIYSISNNEYFVPEDGTDDFPEYPAQGSVRFDKTATAVGNYSQTGIAKVELSMTGVPIKQGTDVIIMLDTSSSMTKNNVTGTNKTRAKVLEESLEKLIAQLQERDADGNYMDIKVAIADFNGYYGDGSGGTSGTPYDRTSGDYVKNGNSNGSGYNQASEAQVYTGTKALNAGAFVAVDKLAATYTLNYTSGTNYDYAFDAIYQLGTAIKAANTEDRELIVVFMSDGASLQWNYFGTQNSYTKWNNWLSGSWKASDLTTSNLNSTAHSYFYDLNDHDDDGHINEHRMANAIKGDPNKRYEIIRKSTAGLPEGTLVSAGKDYLYTVPGLGATMYTINFDAKQDGQITVDNIDKALSSTASDKTGTTQYYYKVTSADQLETAFENIGHAIIYAAKNVVVKDKIGGNYTLNFKLPNSNVTADEAGMSEFYIRVLEYKLDANKERTGTPAVLENFTFDANGAMDTHTVDGVITCRGTDCKHVTFQTGRVVGIKGTYFEYTCGPALDDNDQEIKDEFGNTKTEEYLTWNADKLTTTELVMEYFAYLDNSAGLGPDQQVPAGTYYTNDYATLTYDNVKGNRVQQEFPIPQMTWKGAMVTYVFYLVNEAGQPVNRAGRVIPFAESFYVTDPVTFDVHWNEETGSENILAHDIFASAGVPDVYKLYDEEAQYVIRVYQTEDVDTNGVNGNYFQISGSDEKLIDSPLDSDTTKNNSTTVVFNTKAGKKYDEYGYYSIYPTGTQLTNGTNTITTTVKADDIDYANTTVAFAVVWKPELEPDTVVIDYGLDVVIDVIKNDSMAAGVVGVRMDKPDTAINSGTYTAAKAQTVDVYIDSNNDSNNLKENKIGTASVESMNQVRFTLDKTNGMQFTDPAVFYYEANVNYYDAHNELKTASMYSSVTVIPATTVYYEDEYVKLRSFVKDADGNYTESTDASGKVVSGWDKESVAEKATQAVDRPGENKIGSGYDSDNIYGYDPAYANSSTYSLDDAAMVNVNDSKYATATFEFFGTGFDIVSMTSNTTGTIVVKVYPWEDTDYSKTASRSHIVDTYYGYEYGPFAVTYTYKDGEWIETVEKITAEQMREDGEIPKDPKDGETYTVYQEWRVTDPQNPNALYQVPVMKVAGLAYNKYKAVITASYVDMFDHTADPAGYDFYLDAIRVYDPCGKNDETANGAYGADGEFAPKYEELRNEIISADTFAGFFEVANIKTFDEKLTYFTKDEKGNFIEVAQDEEPVPGILYYTVEANEVNEFAEGTTYFTKVESEYYIQVAESKAYNAQKNYYIRAGYEQVEIDAFAEGITYYTKHEEVSYTQVLAEEAFDTEKTYYTAKYEQAEIDAFAEGVTYYAKDGDNSFAEVPTEEAFDAAKTYYIIKYEQAEIDAFAEGVTYYTKNVEISYTEVPAEEAFDAAKTYYTDKYEKIEIDAFEEDVIYYTKDIDYIVTASDALVEDVTYYTVKSQVEKISKFISGVNYFVKDASDRFSVLAPNESPAEDKLYYIMAEGIRINGIGFLNTTFIDGKGNIANIADYQNYGPNNEVYLAPDQAVAGNMFTTATINGYKACVYLGIKSVVGEASVKVYGVDTNGVETVAVNEKLSTATDMYYDISNLIGKTIVIHNSGSSGIVSITNVKTAYEKVKSPTNPANEESLTPNSVNAAAETEESMFTVDSETLKLALLSLSEPIKVEQPDAPEGGEPGGNEPGGEPEGGEPGGNEPGGEPEGGEPGGNEPGGEPEGGEPGGNEPSGEPEGGEPGGNEPGGEPEGGEPGGDAPQDPAPSEPVPEETEPEEKDSVEETIQDIVEIIRDIIGIIGGMFRGWF